MKTLNIWKELVHRNKPLAYAGLFFLAMSLFMPILMVIDDRQVTGIDPWIKPLKFDLSTVVYLWTLAWLFYYLKDKFPRSVKRMSWAVIIFMIIEIGCIKMQAARGVASHFNNQTLFDGLVFALMGIIIFINTAVMTYAWILFLVSAPRMAPAYLWGTRIGFLVFLLGCLAGVVMTMQNQHTVGLADGGAGLPLLNWSTIGGDLRPVHFLGLHALQLFPLIGYLFHRYQVRLIRLSPAMLTILFCVCYVVLSIMVFNMAMAGKPLVGMVAK